MCLMEKTNKFYEKYYINVRSSLNKIKKIKLEAAY